MNWTGVETRVGNPAVGQWTDAVYLSSSTTWNVSDPKLGTALSLFQPNNQLSASISPTPTR